MLNVLFSYEGTKDIFEILTELGFQYQNGKYKKNNELLKYELIVLTNHEQGQLELQFSKELSLEQYKDIHEIVCKLKNHLDAQIDDKDALMGYLKNGDEAFIYHEWVNWLFFLEEARHESMIGQKVQIYDHQLLVGEGVLVEALKDELEENDYKIISSTIITKAGEKTFIGNLRIIPTGEF